MSQRAAIAPWLRWAIAAAAIALAPLLFRVLLIVDRSVSPRLEDGRGLVSDAAVSLALLALLWAAGRGARWLAIGAAPIWAIVHYGNYETVRALGALASFRDLGYVGDATFFQGSVLTSSRPLLFAAVLVASGALLWLGLSGATRRAAAVAAVAAATLAGAHALWPWADDVAVWRQTNVVHHNARGVALAFIGGDDAPSGFHDAPSAMLDLAPDLAADLSGEPRPQAPAAPPATNVLLVVLEGVSGAHIETLAADHGQRPFLAMPELDAVTRRSLAFSTFVNHQRRTNRGLYALLCGELPNLLPGLPKMSDYVEGGRICLPELMRDAGYETVFLQAAPLAFMLKDQFMPRIGFEQVHGGKWFERAYARNKWGVDDRAFFEQAAEMIESLQRGERPWLLTLLTVGTHHPYLFPADFMPKERRREVRALAYLDGAIGAFQKRLDALGVREDTLVLFTSDESLGIAGTKDYLSNVLSQNWGFLLAQAPGGRAGLVREPFAQMDVATSILDLVGLSERGRHLFGRSVFRRYAGPRYLFFANTNQLLVGAVDPYSRVLLCRKDLDDCRKYRYADGRVFGALARERWDPELDDIVHEMAARSLRVRSFAAPRRDFELLADPVFVSEKRREELIHGGQYIDLKRGEWVEVELEITARGDTGRSGFRHTLRVYDIGLRTNTHRTVYATPPIPLSDGDRLRLRYTFAPSEEAPGVQCRSYASLLEGSSVVLDFETARLSLHRSGTRPPPGVVVEYLEVEPGSG